MFKSLGANDRAIRPFKVYKSFTFTPADSGSGVYALEGISGSLYNYSSSSAASQSYGIYNAASASVGKQPYSLGTFYKLPTFFSMEHLYYDKFDQPFNSRTAVRLPIFYLDVTSRERRVPAMPCLPKVRTVREGCT